ncbi:MAG: FTR1 family protein [Aestuariivirga sp.]
MIGALIIVFREMMEAGLIVGILMAATKSVPGSRVWILGGVLAGLLGSAIVAIFTGFIASSFEGSGEELFNAAILATAVLMLIWHSLWMIRNGRSLAANLKEAGKEVATGKRTFWALAVIVGTAVMREGSEVVLFLYGIAINNGATSSGLLLGGILGVVAGGLISALTYQGMLKIPMRHFFSVTNALITLLAAGMAAQSVAYLEKAGVSTLFSETIWNTSAVLSEKSILGRILHTLLGYVDRPSLMQLIAYLAVIAVVYGSGRLLSHPRPHIAKQA